MKAFNFITNVEYSGKNAFLEGNGKYNAFATFNQISSSGYKINKGAKGINILCGYWTIDKKNKAGEIERKTVPKHAIVFDICDTNALDDLDLVEFLDNGTRIPSEQQINQEIMAKVLA